MQKKNQSIKNISPLISINLTPNMALQSQSHSQLLLKTYPHIAALNSLRIFTTLEIIYLLQLYIDLMEKNGFTVLSNFRIGIIGGGITGRIILNSILPFSKDGLDLKNITMSTRQPENFKQYVEIYGIRVLFDNQLTARESDFLIIATPATLDNWIITDLKDSLDKRVREGDRTTKQFSITPLLMEKNSIDKTQLMTGSTIKQLNMAQSPKPTIPEKVPESKRNYRPLVYILTSDFSQQKCRKLFNFPVLTPSIRAKDIASISETLKLYSKQGNGQKEYHENLLIWWLTKQNESKQQNYRLDSYESKSEVEGSNSNQIDPVVVKYMRTSFFRIVNALAFVIHSPKNLTSLSSSVSNTISISSSLKDHRQHQQSLHEVIESATAHGTVDKTFHLKIKKWKMAFSNFIS